MCQIDKVKYPQTVELFMDTNVFISDTRESVNITEKIQGFINNMKPVKGDSMNLPHGTKTATEIIYD